MTMDYNTTTMRIIFKIHSRIVQSMMRIPGTFLLEKRIAKFIVQSL